MAVKVTHRVLEAVWSALQSPPRPNFVHNPPVRAATVAKNGWADKISVSDLLEDYDPRIRGIPIVELAGALGLPFQTVYEVNGRKTQRNFMGFESIRIADAAALMAKFERLGFNVDPTPLVDLVLPSLRDFRSATHGDLTVLQFHSVRHRMCPIELIRDTALNGWAGEQRITTATRYKATGIFDASGKIRLLTIFAPRYRRSPDPVATRCPGCGLEYMRGDPDDSSLHRLEHKKRMRVLSPQPNAHALAAIERGWQGTVDERSPKWMQREIYARAKAFRCEQNYDIVQWSRDGEHSPEVRGFLFTDRSETVHKGTIQGACCFRWRNFQDRQSCWSLDWIWLAPPVRRQGILSGTWPKFVATYGRLHVAQPLSTAMQRFVSKVPYVYDTTHVASTATAARHSPE